MGALALDSFEEEEAGGEARPGEAGSGVEDGIVTANIYLGNSVETWVKTDLGNVLVQIDNPDVKKIWDEGERVSLSFDAALTKVLVDDLEQA